MGDEEANRGGWRRCGDDPVGGGAVGATPPNHFEDHFEDEFDIVCDGFVLHESFTVDIHGTDHFDRNGEFVRSEAHITFEGVITGPDGLVLRDPGHFHETFAAEDESLKQTGLIFKIVVPGRGSVAQDTGYVEFFPDGTIVIHGPHEVFEGPPRGSRVDRWSCWNVTAR